MCFNSIGKFPPAPFAEGNRICEPVLNLFERMRGEALSLLIPRPDMI